MVFRSVMTALTVSKIGVSILLYFGFLLQVFAQISSKFSLLKSLFGNVLNPEKYDLRKDSVVLIGWEFLVHLTASLLAIDRLSTCILQDLKKKSSQQLHIDADCWCEQLDLSI
jgi:hypothetical protein